MNLPNQKFKHKTTNVEINILQRSLSLVYADFSCIKQHQKNIASGENFGNHFHFLNLNIEWWEKNEELFQINLSSK